MEGEKGSNRNSQKASGAQNRGSTPIAIERKAAMRPDGQYKRGPLAGPLFNC